MPLAWGRRYLMCPPEHFGVLYEINSWMHTEVAVDVDTARAQWDGLVAGLQASGAQVEVMDPVDGLPDLVFTANAGVVNAGQFVPARFRHPERQRRGDHAQQQPQPDRSRVRATPGPAEVGEAPFEPEPRDHRGGREEPRAEGQGLERQGPESGGDRPQQVPRPHAGRDPGSEEGDRPTDRPPAGQCPPDLAQSSFRTRPATP